MKSKKKITTTALAVVLAVLLLIGGGTFAYLQSTTDDVTNTFKANKVMVDLKETTGSDYNIVPGTAQTKDPTVTVNATVPAYVYVEVKDTTNGLVGYEIADGWTKLDGYDNVYYREVSGADEAQSFGVLKGDKVTYSAALENSDMLDGNNLKSGIELTFKAHAIQKEGFADAEAAYKQIPAEAKTAADVEEAVKAGKAVELANDITIPVTSVTDKNLDIDLNGKTMTVTGGNQDQIINKGQTVTYKNGTVNFENGTDPTKAGITLSADDSELNLNNVTVETKNSILVARDVNSATINITDSNITTGAYYVVNTNAANPKSGRDVKINIKNSTLTTSRTDHDDAAILFNIPGTLSIEDSTITGDRQAVIVRCGTANIKNSTLNCTATYSNPSQYDNKNWSSGNEVPVATLVVGNRTTGGYPHDATCTVSGTTFTLGNGTTGRTPVYAAAYNGYTTTLSGIAADDITQSKDEKSTITIK